MCSAAATPATPAPPPPQVVLISDLPSKATNYTPVWDFRSAVGNSSLYRAIAVPLARAAAALELPGVVRYTDAVPRDTDVGVVALREMLLAIQAERMAVCVRAECAQCTRTESKYVEEMVQRRQSRSLAYMKTWMGTPTVEKKCV